REGFRSWIGRSSRTTARMPGTRPGRNANGWRLAAEGGWRGEVVPVAGSGLRGGVVDMACSVAGPATIACRPPLDLPHGCSLERTFRRARPALRPRRGRAPARAAGGGGGPGRGRVVA